MSWRVGCYMSSGMKCRKPVFYLGTGAWFYGCYSFAKGKGYSGWLGLLGMLSILGLIIFIVLPDKYGQEPSTEKINKEKSTIFPLGCIISFLIFAGAYYIVGLPVHKQMKERSKQGNCSENFDMAVRFVKDELEKKKVNKAVSIDAVGDLNKSGRKNPYNRKEDAFANARGTKCVVAILNGNNLKEVDAGETRPGASGS